MAAIDAHDKIQVAAGTRFCTSRDNLGAISIQKSHVAQKKKFFRKSFDGISNVGVEDGGHTGGLAERTSTNKGGSS